MKKGYCGEMKIQLMLGDITKIDNVQAIVNAANESLLGGGGVDGAIHFAAGSELLEECRTLGGCRIGEAKLTKGYLLPCEYVIHTVGPRWHGGNYGEADALAACYVNSLEVAREHGIRSIAFPAISTGAFGYPVKEAAKVAVKAVNEYLTGHEDDFEAVYLVMFDRQTHDVYKKALDDVLNGAEDKPVALRSDWKNLPMPEQCDHFTLKRKFSEQEMKNLRHGGIPQVMEDKWFWYMEGNKLYAHRSWTGYCIYEVEFSDSEEHQVTVNRDPGQYKCTSITEDRAKLFCLLDWWVKQ